ncbi:MAG: LytTR family DNA-binding domain-containing protein [Brevundimonas sp.]|nr:LytTR family DNA-binding domain-containing protein [Brevundimonas sp.]
MIAEDEPLALEGLQRTLASFPGVEIVGSASDGDQALALIIEKRPDLALLDIAMPRLSGLDVARLTAQSARPPLCAFLTAYADFAVNAFALDALDYVLKPFTVDRLSDTIGRARRRLAQVADPTPLVVDAAPDKQPNAPFDSEFWVPTKLGFRRLPVSDILWIEAARDYVLLHSDTRTDIVRARMNDLEERLDPRVMRRVHRSHFVNPSAVAEVQQLARSPLTLVLSTGQRIDVGRSYLNNVRRIIGPATVGRGAKAGDPDPA